jgi:hypothetical protein
MLLTSYDTFRELRDAGLTERERIKALQDGGRRIFVQRPTG